MAIQTRRDSPRRITDLWNRPIEWVQGRILRLLDWFNYERWTTLFTVSAAVLANLIILFFFLQEQDNRAIAFTIVLFVAILSIFVVEVAVTAFIVIGTQLFVNALYYAAPGVGTGAYTSQILLLLIVSGRAIYEYLRLSPAERPRLFTWLTGAVLLFWGYYMVIVVYHYIFYYDALLEYNPEFFLGIRQPGILRYMDGFQLWIGVLPLIILLRNWERARRVLIALGIIMILGVGSIVWEYFSPLPMFFKVMFQLQAAGETTEGYRIRDPVSLYLGLVGFFFAVYGLGYLRGKWSVFALLYIGVTLLALFITKNRILWVGVFGFLPFALLLKSPIALVRQLQVMTAAGLLLASLMLHPAVYDATSRAITEAVERWNRTFTYGGDPRLDPAYQPRLRELEAWQHYFAKTTIAQRLFGSGLAQPYGYYVKVAEYGYAAFEGRRVYAQKTQLHFQFYNRIHRIGIVGSVLLHLTLLVFFIRAAILFMQVRSFYLRGMIVGIVGATIGAIAYDSLHGLLHRAEFVPIVLLWSVLEAIPHWQRTNQLTDLEPTMTTT
ncbi:MAG: hypothetical protein QW094_07935 [Candidatus Caldarchaeum sp.]